jgi:hypothetical protein
MVGHYGRAEAIARKTGTENLFYPAMNCIAAELRLGVLEAPRRLPKLDEDRIEIIRESFTRASNRQPNFWSLAGLIELDLFVALAKENLTDTLPGILGAYRQLKDCVSAPFLWDSVDAQARLVLEPYAKTADDAEAKAAQELLLAIKGYASASS